MVRVREVDLGQLGVQLPLHGVGMVVAQPYALYSWLLFPVLIRATIRLVARRDSWAKTDREPVGEQTVMGVGGATAAR